MKLPRVILLVVLDILVSNLAAFLALCIRLDFDFASCVASGFLDIYVRWSIPNTLAVLAAFAIVMLSLGVEWSEWGEEMSLNTSDYEKQVKELVNGFNPKLVISGHENEMGHTIDHREAFWLTFQKMEEIKRNYVVMGWGEWFLCK